MKNLSELDKKYRVVVADPPWEYKNTWKTGTGRTQNGMTGAATKYPTLPLADIKCMDVESITDESGCVLFLWGTMPLIENAMDVMTAWGFRYKTSLVWVKTDWLGLGRWFRTNTEMCLIGTVGNVKPFNSQTTNIIHAQPNRHSRKPDVFWDKINTALAPTGLYPRIELFAREKHDGYDAWGLDVE